jgi:hypothetical protein
MVMALCAFFHVVPSATAADENIGQQVGTITVPSGLEMDDVKNSIIRALLQRRWEIKENAAGKVVAHYARGDNEATLTIKYDDKEIAVFAVGRDRHGG